MDSFDECNLVNLLEKQIQKLSMLENATTLLKNEESVKAELKEIHLTVFRIMKEIDNLEKQLESIKNENEQMKNLFILLETLKKKTEHMENNIPPVFDDLINVMDNEDYSQNYVCNNDIVNSTSLSPSGDFKHTFGSMVNSTMKENHTVNHKKSLFNDVKACHYIALLNEIEFSNIPSYIIGRQTISTLNGLIKSLNEVLKDKYKIVTLGKVKAKKKGELDRYLDYKKEELTVNSKNGKTPYFFTANDYYKYTKMKLDKIKLNLLTALKHCKRLEFIKVGKDLFYAVVD